MHEFIMMTDPLDEWKTMWILIRCFRSTLLSKETIDKSLSYDVMSGSEITPCNKIHKPLVVYRFLGNVMMSITKLLFLTVLWVGLQCDCGIS